MGLDGPVAGEEDLCRLCGHAGHKAGMGVRLGYGVCVVSCERCDDRIHALSSFITGS